MKALFTRKTFQYFDLAAKNRFRKGWFEKNKALYQDAVKAPMSVLIEEVHLRLARELPGVVISPRKISRPVPPAAKAEAKGYVKAGSMFFLSEKTTSQFEWNPGLYLHLGNEKEDNMMGMGLYGPSSRQIKRLRGAFLSDHETIEGILANRKFRKAWGPLADEKYVRFPKDHSPDHAAARYLWYKQFYVHQRFTRKEVTSPGFVDLVLQAFTAGVPFMQWVRQAIGIYDRLEYERDRRDRMDRESELSL